VTFRVAVVIAPDPPSLLGRTPPPRAPEAPFTTTEIEDTPVGTTYVCSAPVYEKVVVPARRIEVAARMIPRAEKRGADMRNILARR
jgi:hypothetical protein